LINLMLSNGQFAGLQQATGLDASGTNDNRVSLQTQLDAAAANSRALVITEPGTYKLTATGTLQARYCLTLTDPTKRYGLILGPGVVLKCANNQATTGNPVKMFYSVDHSGGFYLGWPFGGRGGVLDGNTANQPGWESGYEQMLGSSGVWMDATVGNGCKDFTIEALTIQNWFSNSIVVGFMGSIVYGSGSERVHAINVKSDACGEGIVFGGIDFFSMVECEDVGVVDKMKGDAFEPAGCRYGHVHKCIAHTNGVLGVGGGAGIDVYASRDITISDCIIEGRRAGITCETDFGDVDNYCDMVVASNCVLRGLGTQGITTGPTIGIIPAQGGRSTFSNMTLENFPLSGFQLNAVQPTDGSPGADFSMSNVNMHNCGHNVLQVLGGNIRAHLNNVSHLIGDAIYAYSFGRAGGSYKLYLDISGGSCYGFTHAAILFVGSGQWPVGRISGMDISRAGGLPRISVGTGVDLTQLDAGDLGLLSQLTATTSFVPLPMTNIWYFDSSNGDLVTLATGLPYQTITIFFMFGGGTIRDFRANGSGNIRLAGAVNKTFARYDVLQLQWVDQVSEWWEVSRSINS